MACCKNEFSKSCAKRAYEQTLSTCQRASVVYMPTWRVSTCQKRANLSFLRVNVPINVPMCHTAYQCFNQTTCKFFNLACQRAKIHDTFSDIPLRKCNGKFLYFIVIKKFYIILDIIVIHIVSIWCIVHKSCIRFHFYTLFHSKEKCVEFFFFFFSFLGL